MFFGFLALFCIFLSLAYMITEAYILRERFHGNIPYSVKEKFLEKRMPLPVGIIAVCLIIVWIAFVH